VRSLVRGIVWIAGIFGALVLLLHLFLFDTWVVPTDDALLVASVKPALTGGDRIVIQRASIPRYGQLARCTLSSGAVVIGRVFGMEGDLVEIKREQVFTAGKRTISRHGCPPVTLLHPVTQAEVELFCSVEDNGAWTYEVLAAGQYPEGERQARVPPGHLYLVSDNRHIHQDSRDFGPVEESRCGHVVFRLWGESYVDSSRRNTILW
jgi:signal peptidase I